MKKYVISLILILIVSLLVSCGNGSGEAILVINEESIPDVEENAEEIEEIEEEIEILEDTSCLDNSECETGLLCINKECQKLTKLYDTESSCDMRCNFDSIVLSTSDGDKLTLSRGQGSYTAAGALEWKLVSSADYCMQDETLVAVKLLKKNYGKIISEEVVTLTVGETSDTITHPQIASIGFTLTVESINEQCS